MNYNIFKSLNYPMMNKIIYLSVLVFSCLHGFTQQVADKNQQEIRFTTKINNKYLQIPIKNGAAKRNVDLYIKEKKVYGFNVELDAKNPDWYAYIDVTKWKGDLLEIRIDSTVQTNGSAKPITQISKKVSGFTPYTEKQRGQFHFSAKNGWLNDPNGLVYYNGEYHLFFQHNPYGVNWGNMHWGHAVSTDLIHWKELDIALYPDEFGTIYSGGGLVDKDNTSGLGINNKAPMLVFYTAAGKVRTQNLAYSNDGRHFTKFSKPLVNEITRGNRDPKVIWYEPAKHWVMVVYVTEPGGQHTIHFLTSKNLIDWTSASVMKGDKGKGRYLYECPEFFELPVVGNESIKKWILVGADGQYAIGTFDGKTFHPEQERLKGHNGRGYYAAQTFSNEPQGRRVEMGWWQTETGKEGAFFNQSMSIPMELKLVNAYEGLRLIKMPVEELKQLRDRTYNFGPLTLNQTSKNPLADIRSDLLEIRTSFSPSTSKMISFKIRNIPILYDVVKSEIIVDGRRIFARMLNGKIDLIIYADRTGMEIFVNNGLIFIPLNKNLDMAEQSVDVAVTGGNAVFDYLNVYTLKSAWTEK
jgi:fructan beta-fructosidase